MTRRIVQIAAFVQKTDNAEVAILCALADDGTMWELVRGRPWAQVPGLPQPEPAAESDVPLPGPIQWADSLRLDWLEAKLRGEEATDSNHDAGFWLHHFGPACTDVESPGFSVDVYRGIAVSLRAAIDAAMATPTEASAAVRPSREELEDANWRAEMMEDEG